MKTEFRQDDDVTILTLAGELDGVQLPELRRELDGAIDQGARKLVIESPELAFIGSSGLGYLVSAAKKLQSHDGRCVVAAPSRFFQKTLDHLGLGEVLPVFDSVDAAVTHLRAG
jgi:anti-sigma B factor antagonist